jgi:hypothetical protein
MIDREALISIGDILASPAATTAAAERRLFRLGWLTGERAGKCVACFFSGTVPVFGRI